MRRLAFLAFCALTGCGLVVSGLGVGPTADGGIDGIDGATSIDGAPLDDSATVDGASDVITVGDADADSNDPILPVADPGFIGCTFQPCVAGVQFCCIGKGTCEGNPSACGRYKEVHCNEPADCPTQKCCLGRNSAESDHASFRCASDCNTVSGYQVCRTSADCAGAMSSVCIAVTCLGYTVGTCGGKLPPQCADGG